MKYLEYSTIEELNQALACVDMGEFRLFGRLEAYSCKNSGDDRKLRNHLETKYLEVGDELSASLGTSPEMALSPSSPFGPLSQSTSRKTMFYLLATLNAAYPDYDFSDVKPEYFHRIPGIGMAANFVNTALFNLGNDSFAKNAGGKIWETVDEVVKCEECEIYQFQPDRGSEPDADDGNLWSFYFLFFNRKLKRVLLLTCRAVNFMSPVQIGIDEVDYVDDGGMEIDDDYRRNSYDQFTMHNIEV
ncbi:Maf1 regulator-domain-containing protein [Cladochytrium replicatum]|nr:Maf1 regulator-domain-containing protein [Cladochytrium replicatum]